MSEVKITEPHPANAEPWITAEDIEAMFPGGKWTTIYDETTGAPIRTYTLKPGACAPKQRRKP